MPTKSETLQIAAIMRELSSLAEHAVRDIAVGVLDGASAATPVDTGASASSWRAAARKAGPVVKRTGAAIAASQAAQEVSKVKLGGYRLGPKIFIGSSQPGVEQLNNGSSRQEPKAFVQRAIAFSLSKAKVSTSVRAAAGRRGRR